MLGILALLFAAQQPPISPGQPDNEIVVTGERPLRTEEARRHVNAITQTAEGQIARFQGPVCPVVVGMSPREAAVVIARIREVAANAGIQSADPGCRANLALIVTPDGRRLVAELHRRRPRVFAGLEPHQMRRLLRNDEPVRVWRSTELLNEDGFGVNPVTGMLTVRSASIISEPTQLATVQSVVVIEDAAADGKSLGQLADYAAMRTLGGARPPQAEQAEGSTILNLFYQAAQAPLALTALDSAYLRALYASRANQRSVQQMGQMSRMIAEGASQADQSEETQN